MKIKKHFLIAGLVILFLCIPATGQRESEQYVRPALAIRVNPALTGITELRVVVVPNYADLSGDEPVWAGLRGVVEQELVKAGFTIASVTQRGYIAGPSDIPELRIDINMYELLNMQRRMFFIQTSLVKNIYPEEDRRVFVNIEAWTMGATVQVRLRESALAVITSLVVEQVDAFINAHFAANPQRVLFPDVNDVNVFSMRAGPRRGRPSVRAAVAEYKYVASKKGRVFHTPDCSSAKRIKPENLIGYSSREEAIEAGKRRCRRCKP